VSNAHAQWCDAQRGKGAALQKYLGCLLHRTRDSYRAANAN